MELLLDEAMLQQLGKYLTKAELDQSIKEFLVDAYVILTEVEVALVDKNMTVAIRAFHTLKGNSRTLGANALAVLCQDAENELKKTAELSDRSLILQQLAGLISQYSVAVRLAGYCTSE
jgi:HPt (histidine-containing phosphotransfer) domain-containing protein